MKRKSISAILGLLLFAVVALSQERGVTQGQKNQSQPTRDLIVRATINSSEIVGDEFVNLELAVLVLQNGKVNWEALKTPENFLPFKVGQIVIQERGVPVDSRFKDYNLFVLIIPLSLPDQSYGQYKVQKLPIEYSILAFAEGQQDVKGRTIKKKIYTQLLPVSKVPMRAYLETDRKSLEIGDQYGLDLNVVFDSKTSLLNLKFQENSQQKKENFLDNSLFPDHEVINLHVIESQESRDRFRAKVMYNLTSFAIPPKLLKIGPLDVVYRVGNEENARVYKTSEIYVQLNSVLTKYSTLESTRPVYFKDEKQRFWLIVIPRYAAGAILSALVLFSLFRLITFLYSLRLKHEAIDALPISRLMNARRHIPLFVWHWSCLGFLILFKPSSNKRISFWVKHTKMCVGSVFGLSIGKSLSLTAAELKPMDSIFGNLLSNLESSLLSDDSKIELPTRKSLLRRYSALPLWKIVYGIKRSLTAVWSKLKGFGRRVLTQRSKKK